MPGCQLEYLTLETLILNPRNARTHSRRQIQQIAKSIAEFGFAAPILIDEKNVIIAGHGRLEAARQLQILEVPCVRLSHLTATQKKALALADNRIPLDAGWDEEILALEIKAILEDSQIDIGTTGFSLAEIDTAIEGLGVDEPGSPRDDSLPALDEDIIVARPGDLWILGPHRLICGDALDPQVTEGLMAGEMAQMVFTDPPYNLRVDDISGLGKTKHREFEMASGEMPPAAFTAFVGAAFKNFAKHSVDGAIHFVCMDWRHQAEILEAAKLAPYHLKNLVVWDKGQGGMGSFYRSRHELIYVFKSGAAPHINNFELGQHGRYRTNVWTYRGLNSFGSGRDASLAVHPTVKPVAMIADAIKDVSGRGGIVLDLFGGSGSTLIAAHKTGRRGYLSELDPVYCDRIIRRYEAFCKDDAILASTGETFRQRLGNQAKLRSAEEEGQIPGATPPSTVENNIPQGHAEDKASGLTHHE